MAKVHVIVNKIWRFGNKMAKIDAFVVNSTTIKFRIQDNSVPERILRRGMWNIADVPMIVSKWSPVEEEMQPECKSIPMWIKIMNIPHKKFTWKGIVFLASAVGVPKKLHLDTEFCSKFDEARVFVQADISKEFPKSFRFKADNEVDAVVDFEYPWLPQGMYLAQNGVTP